MNNAARKLYLEDALPLLSIKNAEYRSAVKKICALQLELDDCAHDVTTQVVFGSTKNEREAFVVAKSDGIVTGVEEISWFLNTHSAIKAHSLVKNGARITRATPLLTLKGTIGDLMSHERMILNLIAHMSGIANHAKELLGQLGPIKNAPLLASTRKTRFGVLDKAACVIVGAGSHRLTLNDAVIIKHNHLHAVKNKLSSVVTQSLERASTRQGLRFFEVEVTTPRDALEVAQIFQLKKSKLPCVMMLDNFAPPQAQKLIVQLDRLYPHRAFVIEVSGGISKFNLKNYAKIGADVLSLGNLTYGASFFDVSMRMK